MSGRRMGLGWKVLILALVLVAGMELEEKRQTWLEGRQAPSAEISPPSREHLLKKSHHACRTLTFELRQARFHPSWTWR